MSWPPYLRDLGNASWGHYCPGCRIMHRVFVTGGDGLGNRWEFNGDQECPTFQRSLIWHSPVKRDGVRKIITCHYTLTMGFIAYASDCEHELAGQTVLLPRIPEAFMPVDDDIL